MRKKNDKGGVSTLCSKPFQQNYSKTYLLKFNQITNFLKK